VSIGGNYQQIAGSDDDRVTKDQCELTLCSVYSQLHALWELVTTAWHVLGLRMEETACRYGA
jgi:hypothetical protein